MTTTYQFKAGYTKLGIATAPAPAPTIDIVDDSDNLLINNGVCIASVNMPGLYIYNYSGADDLVLIGLFHTADTTVDQQDLFAQTPVFQVDVNVKRINGVVIQGTGTPADKWRPA